MIGKSMRRRLLLLILIVITMKNKIKKIILLIIYMIVCDIMIYYDICIKKYFCSKLTHDCKCLKAWNTCSRRHHKYENFSYMFDSLNFPTIKFSSKTKRLFPADARQKRVVDASCRWDNNSRHPPLPRCMRQLLRSRRNAREREGERERERECIDISIGNSVEFDADVLSNIKVKDNQILDFFSKRHSPAEPNIT